MIIYELTYCLCLLSDDFIPDDSHGYRCYLVSNVVFFMVVLDCVRIRVLLILLFSLGFGISA